MFNWKTTNRKVTEDSGSRRARDWPRKQDRVKDIASPGNRSEASDASDHHQSATAVKRHARMMRPIAASRTNARRNGSLDASAETDRKMPAIATGHRRKGARCATRRASIPARRNAKSKARTPACTGRNAIHRKEEAPEPKPKFAEIAAYQVKSKKSAYINPFARRSVASTVITSQLHMARKALVKHLTSLQFIVVPDRSGESMTARTRSGEKCWLNASITFGPSGKLSVALTCSAPAKFQRRFPVPPGNILALHLSRKLPTRISHQKD